MKRRAFMIGGLGCLLLLGGAAMAAIPDAVGVIHACYRTSNPAKGAVIVIDSEASETCPSGTASLNWNQTGPQGAMGPTGAPGMSGYEIVHEVDTDNVGPQGPVSIDADCPEGKVAVGGGWVLGGFDLGNPPYVEKSIPLGSQGWRVGLANVTELLTLEVVVACVAVA